MTRQWRAAPPSFLAFRKVQYFSPFCLGKEAARFRGDAAEADEDDEDDTPIKALCRWKDDESVRTYARLNPEQYARHLNNARRATAALTSCQAAHLPRYFLNEGAALMGLVPTDRRCAHEQRQDSEGPRCRERLQVL